MDSISLAEHDSEALPELSGLRIREAQPAEYRFLAELISEAYLDAPGLPRAREERAYARALRRVAERQLHQG